jgi:hypothetical protein
MFQFYYDSLKLKVNQRIIPDYLITMMTEEKKIPYEEVKFLMKKFENSGVLIPLKNNYYRIRI